MKFFQKDKIKFFFYRLISFFQNKKHVLDLDKKYILDSEVETLLNKKVPPLPINYNSRFSFNPAKYKKAFINDYLFNYFYNIISELQKKRIEKKIYNTLHFPKFLDLGCGFGPLALALKLNMLSKSKLKIDIKNNDIIYCGVDIREDCINFLKNAYKGEDNFYFHRHIVNDLSKNVDYLDNFNKFKQSKIGTVSESDGSETLYNLPFNFKSDIQWSSSFFTHLTPTAFINALKFICHSLHEDGLAINSFLILDNESYLSLKMGNADRSNRVMHDFGNFISPDIKNPLSATIYKLEFIEESFKNNGLRINSIQKGSWRGCNYRNNYHHYQDIIVAEKY
jgi:SAM-dependent methyltransferase